MIQVIPDEVEERSEVGVAGTPCSLSGPCAYVIHEFQHLFMGERTYVSVPELFPEFTQDELIGSEGMGFGMGLVVLHANIDT
ncbi:MAG TPA: hypothetical protein PLS25_03750, partial [Methanoregulaceae archaeon]|nr:hypothetical protein [Methanoregulaceae archaeon]